MDLASLWGLPAGSLSGGINTGTTPTVAAQSYGAGGDTSYTPPPQAQMVDTPPVSSDPFQRITDIVNGQTNGRPTNGQQFALPTVDPNSKAPTYSAAGFGTASMDPALKMTMTAGNQGSMAQGVNAFLGTGWTPYVMGGGLDGQTVVKQDNSGDLFNLAKSIGFDTSGYNPKDQTSVNQLYGDLNSKLGNYYNINGLSSGWTGGSDPRGASSTMYIKQGDQFLPTTWGSNNYSAPTSSSINRAQNMDTLSALSMMMPAFGGVSGILGAGAEGTLSAGSGLGLTNGVAGAIGSGATNALVNAGSNYLFSGGQGGLQGIAGSLAGSLGSAAGNSVLGKAGGLGDMFNTANAGAMGSVYNPMQGFNQGMATTGTGTALGGIAGLFSGLGGGGSINAATMSQLGGTLAGQYLGSMIDPRLRGLGGQAGGSLASLFNR